MKAHSVAGVTLMAMKDHSVAGPFLMAAKDHFEGCWPELGSAASRKLIAKLSIGSLMGIDSGSDNERMCSTRFIQISLQV